MTSNLQFAGMEAPTCIFITNNIVEETGARSGLLRATSRLVVVSYAKEVDMKEVKKRFLIHDSPSMNEEERRKGEERKRITRNTSRSGKREKKLTQSCMSMRRI